MTAYLERLAAALADRYRLERELGSGGMATVYLAEDLKHHRQVAVKVLHPELAAFIGAERFLAEIRTTANLQHPHILPLHDSGQADVFLYYVMPYVAGESLRQRLTRERQLPVEEAVRITKEVAGALDYAHRHGVIHRDIKPENILLHEGQALVADFGIALAVSSAGHERMTQTGMSLGTPEYMSPEQALGERDVTAKSDIYALGCVLYEMLTGEPPFTGATVQAVLAKAMAEHPVPPSTVRDTVSPGLEAAVLKAVARLPADRWGSAAALSIALDGQGSTAFVREPVRPSGGKDRLLLGTVLVAVVALAAAIWVWSRTPPMPEGEVAYLPITIAEPPRVRSNWNDGVTLSPDGSKLAYYAADGWYWVDLSTGAQRRVTADFPGLMLAFSPGSDSVALTTASRIQQVYVVDLSTGASRKIADCCFGVTAWDQEGWIYHKDLHNNLIRRNLAGSVEVVDSNTVPQSWGAAGAAPVPGGRGVLFTRPHPESKDPSQADIAVRDFRRGSTKTLMKGATALVTPNGYLLVAQADGKLVASRFDTGRLEAVGNAQVLLEDVEIHIESGPTPRASMSLAGDGTFLYVRRAPLVEDSVVILDRTGRRRGPAVPWGGWVGQVTKSAEGWWAASLNRLGLPNLWVRRGDATTPRRITFSDNLDRDPQFLPGGRHLAFVGSTGGRNWDLYRVPLEGGAKPELLLDRMGDISYPRFTSDARQVVFCEKDLAEQTDIYLHTFGADSATVKLVGSPDYDCSPALSPDGKWLAYESRATGSLEVYVRAIDGADARQWQLTGGGTVAGGGTSRQGVRGRPAWDESGRELFYLNERREIVAVPVTLGASFAHGEPVVLFALDARTEWTGEVLPDGQGFLAVVKKQEAPGQVVMIRNFFKVLRDKVGE